MMKLNEQSAIISYFDDAILEEEQKKYECANYLISCEDDIQRVNSKINNLKGMNFERLQDVLSLDDKVIEKLRFYAFLLKTEYYHLEEEQEQEIKEFFTNALDKIKEDINQVVENNSKTAEINEVIDILKECRGRLIDEDFDLDDYISIFVKLKTHNQRCCRLCFLLANYMNSQLLEQNHISRLSH